MQQLNTLMEAAIGALARAQAAAPDIMESLGPMRPDQPGWTVRRMVAVWLAVGFVIVAFYFLYRRRRRRHTPAQQAAPMRPVHLPDRPDGTEAGEFYHRLLGGLRGALDGREADSYTPRELAEATLEHLPDREHDGRRERVSAMVRRAEEAAYGGADVELSDRRQDLELVTDLVARLAAGPNDAGGPP